MANLLRKVADNLIESISSSGTITAIRAWQPATIYEVDVYIPSVNMQKWNTIRRLKCKVSSLTYRDYTPANWNAYDNTCTLYVEAGHNGAGSHWVKHLTVGDNIQFGPAHAAPLPARAGRILCLGDGSAMGHFMALHQLTDREQFPVETAICLHDTYKVPDTFVSKNPGFEMLMKPQRNSLNVLEQWVAQKELSAYTSVYIAGQISMVSALRRKLKASPQVQARIYAHGFWS